MSLMFLLVHKCIFLIYSCIDKFIGREFRLIEAPFFIIIHVSLTGRDTTRTSYTPSSRPTLHPRRDYYELKEWSKQKSQNSQWLKTLDSMFRRNSPCQERKCSTSCLTESSDPANGTCEKPFGKNASGLIHGNGIHRSQKESYNGDSDGSSNQGRNEPNNEL